MLTKKIIIWIILIYPYLIISCTKDYKIDDNRIKAKELFDSTFRYNYSTANDSVTRIGLSLIDKVIKKDSNFFEAYHNKAIYQCKLKQYYEAISTLQKCIKIKKDDDGSVYFLGLIFEKVGNIDSANFYYLKTLDLYTEKIRLRPYSINLQISKLRLLLLLWHKDKVLVEYEKYYKKYSHYPPYKKLKNEIINFDRVKFFRVFDVSSYDNKG
jgi:tetratricopeptide (TPR) repeat protein